MRKCDELNNGEHVGQNLRLVKSKDYVIPAGSREPIGSHPRLLAYKEKKTSTYHGCERL